MLSFSEIEEGKRRLNKYVYRHFYGGKNWGAPNHMCKRTVS